MTDYISIAKDARKRVLKMIYEAQTSHIGSNFSCIDILTVLFDKIDLDKDKFILSAGWKAASLYYFLWKKGRITKEELESYCQSKTFCKCGNDNWEFYDITKEEYRNIVEVEPHCTKCKKGSLLNNTIQIPSKFIGLTEPIIPEIPFSGGSMGMGLPAAVGFALAKKLKGEDGKVYVLESDGGVQTGTFWEAVMIAAQHKLDNLFLIIDDNGFCAMGKTEEVLDIHRGWPLRNKLSDFGWGSFEVNGHDCNSLKNGFVLEQTMPMCMIAKTIKGYPISFMSGNNTFHYKSLSLDEYRNAMLELNNETVR